MLMSLFLMIFGCGSSKNETRSVKNFLEFKFWLMICLCPFLEDLFDNWYASRGVVLKQDGVCSVHARHVFIDVHGNIVAHIDDTKNEEGVNTTQKTIDTKRQQLWLSKKIDIVQAPSGSTSYPFVYNCTHNVYEEALLRVTGKKEGSLLHGSWKQFKFQRRIPSVLWMRSFR